MTEARDGIFGIDLGTTYSVVSYLDDSGKPVVVLDMMDSSPTMPSVVYFENDASYLVGHTAKQSAILAPDQVVSLVKREMGNKEWRRTFFGKEYDPATVSALILGTLAKNAAADTGRRVEKVVITVPAYFGMLEKQATRQAGEIAGLDVVEVVPEPVAAAFAYGFGGSEASEKTILVYDLGGGTFDVTLMELTPTSVEVVTVDGDHKLGGADWDQVLFEHLAAAAASEINDDSLLEDPYFVQSLWDEAEKLKMKLSVADSRPAVLRAGGSSAKVTVTRTEFEQLTAHLVDRTIDVTKRALETADAKVPGISGRITDVILVGGSSLMPVITNRLKKEFGWDPKLADPHLAVARGAALYAAGAVVRRTIGSAEPGTEKREEVIAGLAEEFSVDPDELDAVSKVKVTNALPKAIGVKLIDAGIPGWREMLRDNPSGQGDPFYVHHLVEPQTPLPHTRPEPFVAGTVTDDQDEVELELWEQAGGVPGRALSENTPLPVDGKGSARITDLGKYHLPAGSPLQLSFNVTAEGIVTLTAVEPTSGKELQVEAKIALLSEDEIQQAKELYNGLTAGS